MQALFHGIVFRADTAGRCRAADLGLLTSPSQEEPFRFPDGCNQISSPSLH
jgi:hypothetical protein